MKIDLHVHTKKNNKSETNKINISAEDFKKEMNNADVGIAAITNHYKFDKEQYDEFCDESFLLLPGVELDILIRNKRVQANVIVSPSNEDIEKFCKILNEIDNHYKNPIQYETFIEKFNNEKWIISLDYKNNTSWDKDDMYDVLKKMDKAFVIADVNKPELIMILNSHKFDALIGSDIKDWADYKIESKKLISTKFNIDNYDNFWLILKNVINMEYISKNIDIKKIENIKTYDIHPYKYEISNLEIKSGVNIIFGAKRTGKTKILESLKEQLDNSILYLPSEKKESMKNLKRELKSETLFSFEKEDFQKNFNDILNYTEHTDFNFHGFYKYIISKESKIKLVNWKIEKYIDPNTNKNYLSFLKIFEELSKNIKKANNILNKNEICKFDNWKKESIIILEKFWNEWINFNKDWLIYKLKTKIKKRISILLKEKNGISSKPNEINIIKRYQDKKSLLNLLESIKDKNCTIENYIRDFEIPGRVENKAYQTINFVDLYKNTTRAYFNDKKSLDAIVSKIKKIKIGDNFKDLTLKLNEWSQKNESLWSDDVVIKDKNNNFDFSNGEAAHLLLDYCLSNEKKDFFLLDEPDIFLSKDSITTFLIPKISELSEKRKTILIATHNSSVGINTIPINYIYRRYIKGNDECGTYIGSIWQKYFINMKDKDDKINFKNEIIESFEGGEKHFNFRKKIYGAN